MTVEIFSRDEVARHHTTSSLWVSVKDKVYDVTQFMDGHPGGDEIMLQYGGQDITKVMQDSYEHSHSDSAYEMMREYCIGQLSGEVSTELVKDKLPFIDVKKPMLAQVWKANFSKEFYVKQVHIPRHTKESAPIFGHPLLEMFTKTPWWVIPIFWTPIISYCIKQCLAFQSLTTLCYLFPLGVLSWTFIEYTLHRFVFHLDDNLPDHFAALTLHFLLHGVHHFLPMDRMRLVMPPALGFSLAYPIWSLFVYAFPAGVGQGMIAGTFTGFVVYDMMHCIIFFNLDYVHHGKPFAAYLRKMKSYHLDHHYKNPHLGYGISSKIWDYGFNTVLKE